MNDPWLPLIAALSGQRTTTPSTWPVRTVHRIDSYHPRAVAQPRPSHRPASVVASDALVVVALGAT